VHANKTDYLNQYSIYISEDGKNWINTSAPGTLKNSSLVWEVRMSWPREAQYVRLVYMGSGSENTVSTAEINVISEGVKPHVEAPMQTMPPAPETPKTTTTPPKSSAPAPTTSCIKGGTGAGGSRPLTYGGSIFYVSPSGSDSVSCAQASGGTPMRTIGAAAKCLRPGDTLFIRGGTYAEEFGYNAIPGGTSWDKPVTIAAYPGEEVILRPNSGASRVFTFIEGQQYIILDGLVMDASNVAYDAVKITCSGDCSSGNAHHIRIQNSEIKNAPSQGILGGEYSEFVNLDVHHNGQKCFGTFHCHGIYTGGNNNLIEGSQFHDQPMGYGIHIYDGSDGVGADNNIVRNNVVYGNSANGMILSSGADNAAYDNTIYNNGGVGIQLDYGADNSQVYNNTIYGNGGQCVSIGGGASGTAAQGNQCNGSGGAGATGAGNPGSAPAGVGAGQAAGAQNCAKTASTLESPSPEKESRELEKSSGSEPGSSRSDLKSGICNVIADCPAPSLGCRYERTDPPGTCPMTCGKLVCDGSDVPVNPGGESSGSGSGESESDSGLGTGSSGSGSSGSGADSSTRPSTGDGPSLPRTNGSSFYISPGGGAGSCEEAKNNGTPMGSIKAALGCLGAGDTLYLRGGTYSEEMWDTIPSGTSWDNPVIVAAYPGERVVLKPTQGARVITFNGSDSHYIVIDGLVMDGADVQYDVVKMDGWPGDMPHHIRIQNSEIMNAPSQGILVGGTGHEFINLDVHNNGNECFGAFHCHGIALAGDGNLVQGSKFHDQPQGYGIHLYNGNDGSAVHDNVVIDNLSYGNSANGLILSSGANNVAYNNTIFNNQGVGIQLDYGDVNSQVYGNTIYSNGGECIYNGAGSSNATIRDNTCN
jgi:parallel beta-helix repeat protein